MQVGQTIPLRALFGRKLPELKVHCMLHDDQGVAAIVCNLSAVSPNACGISAVKRAMSKFPGWEVYPTSCCANGIKSFRYLVVIHRDDIPQSEFHTLKIGDRNG